MSENEPQQLGVHRIVRLLDLFCCAGGAGEGYRMAGFEVTGVDMVQQPKNPHRFILANDNDHRTRTTG